MTKEELIKDFQEMIAAHHKHLIRNVNDGNRTEAHRIVDAIIDTQRELEDLTKEN